MNDQKFIQPKVYSTIKSNLYLTSATVDETGKFPLVTVVFYATDSNF